MYSDFGLEPERQTSGCIQWNSTNSNPLSLKKAHQIAVKCHYCWPNFECILFLKIILKLRFEPLLPLPHNSYYWPVLYTVLLHALCFVSLCLGFHLQNGIKYNTTSGIVLQYPFSPFPFFFLKLCNCWSRKKNVCHTLLPLAVAIPLGSDQVGVRESCTCHFRDGSLKGRGTSMVVPPVFLVTGMLTWWLQLSICFGYSEGSDMLKRAEPKDGKNWDQLWE